MLQDNMFALLAFAQMDIYISDWSFDESTEYYVTQKCSSGEPSITILEWTLVQNPIQYSLPMQKATIAKPLVCQEGEATTRILHEEGECAHHVNGIEEPYYLCNDKWVDLDYQLRSDQYNYTTGYTDGIQAIAAELKAKKVSTIFDVYIFESNRVEIPGGKAAMLNEIDNLNAAFTNNSVPIQFRVVHQQTYTGIREYASFGVDLMTRAYISDPKALNIFVTEAHDIYELSSMPSVTTSYSFMNPELFRFPGYVEKSIGRWFGLFTTDDCRRSVPDTCVGGVPVENNYMGDSDSPDHFSPGQAFRMMTFAYYRKTGMLPQSASVLHE